MPTVRFFGNNTAVSQTREGHMQDQEKMGRRWWEQSEQMAYMAECTMGGYRHLTILLFFFVCLVF